MKRDFAEIAQLVVHERQGRDRGLWDQMRRCYTEDATVWLNWFKGSAREFIAASQETVADGNSSIHRLGPPVIDQHGDRALIDLPAIIEFRTGFDGVEADLAMYARLYYRAERRSSDWLLRSLDAVYIRDTITAVQPGMHLGISPGDVAAHRPSYRFWSYVMSRQGFTIDETSYGDDQPEAADKFYADSIAWLQG